MSYVESLVVAPAARHAVAAARGPGDDRRRRGSRRGRALGVVGVVGLLVACAPRTGSSVGGAAALPPPPPVPRVVQGQLRDFFGNPLWLRGIAFTNRVWQDERLPDDHHAEIDFERVAALGMNSVRFYVHYDTLVDDAGAGTLRPEGFAWLDRNLSWARAHGIYVVLTLYLPANRRPPDAFQFDPKAQERYLELWRALAARYRGEPTIAGYDLLNEASVPQDPVAWRDLAERTIAVIRTVDPEHAVFVEGTRTLRSADSEDAAREPVLVSDPNAVYEFHFYEPFHFTHQGLSWVDYVADEARYPDPERVGVEWFRLQRRAGTDANPKLPVGDSGWTRYEGAPFRVDDPALVVGSVELVADATSGKAYFDDVVVEELDAEGQVVRPVAQLDLDSQGGWFFWSKDGSGARTEEASGRGEGGCLAIAGTRSLAVATGDAWRFPLRQGAVYRVSGWMKGEQIPDGATCQIRLGFASSTAPVHAYDREFLAQTLDGYVDFAKAHSVPLYLGEFGTVRASFQQDRGGERWVGDLLDLILERNLPFAYYAYHDADFGLYADYGHRPEPVDENQALHDLFVARLAAPTPAPPAAEPTAAAAPAANAGEPAATVAEPAATPAEPAPAAESAPATEPAPATDLVIEH